MEVYLSVEFEKDYRKIKDRSLRERIHKALVKLGQDPEAGKPLRYGYKGQRRLRVDPFRIMYSIEGGIIKISCFEHREKAYR